MLFYQIDIEPVYFKHNGLANSWIEPDITKQMLMDSHALLPCIEFYQIRGIHKK